MSPSEQARETSTADGGPKHTTHESSTVTLSLPLAILAVAVFALVYAADINSNRAGNANDPGSRFFPVGIACCLALWSLVELGRYAVSRFRNTADQNGLRTRRPFSRTIGNYGMPIFFIVAMSVYLLAMPRIGFSISTVVLASGVLMMQKMRWYQSLLIAVAMVAVVQLLFVVLFKVQLPTGELGLPF